MRVLHVIPSVARRYGGPSTGIGPLVTALNRLPGVAAEVAATDADGPNGRLAPADTPPGITTHLFRRDFSERWKFSAGLWRWVHRYAAEYDLIHTHAMWSFAPAAAAAAARRARVPYLIRPAGMLSSYTWGRQAVAKRAYWALVERQNVAGAAGFHATSQDEAREIKAVRPGASVVVTPNGVEDAAWTTPPDPDALRRRCGPAAGDRAIILFLSRLHPKKGLTDLLLPALARLPADAFLAIAGGQDSHAPAYEAEVRTTIDRFGLGNRVALLGPVEGPARLALLDGAAAFALPSHSENFGIVVAEAMARGCPVVVTDRVQAADHVTAAGAGRVVPPAVEPLAAVLDAILSDPVGRAAFGRAGRAYAAAHFTWDRVAANVRRLYDDCLAFGRSLRPEVHS
jgi:glycosyltransferase involved in cell wall biosynthesis